MERKDIKITNCAFDLTIHKNPIVIGVQCFLIVIALIVMIFTDDSIMHSTIRFVLLLNVIVAVLIIIKTSKIEVQSAAPKEEKPKQKKSNSGPITNKVSTDTPIIQKQQVVTPAEGVVKTTPSTEKKPEDGNITAEQADKFSLDDWNKIFSGGQ